MLSPDRANASVRRATVVPIKLVVSRLGTIEALLLEIQFELAALAKRLRAVDARLDVVIEAAAPAACRKRRSVEQPDRD